MSNKQEEPEVQPVASWKVCVSQTNQNPYFYNPIGEKVSWEVPADASNEDILKYEKIHQSKGNVRASHLLVKHCKSRNPKSWKQEEITRTREEAEDILKGHQKVLQDLKGVPLATKFAELAKEHSDCSSHKKGGDLMWFKRGAMQPAFEDATLALEVGQMSGIISTDSGVHLILRTG